MEGVTMETAKILLLLLTGFSVGTIFGFVLGMNSKLMQATDASLRRLTVVLKMLRERIEREEEDILDTDQNWQDQ
jgi:hypothetical protein